MVLLNFSHPITPDQLQQIESLTGRKVERLINVPSEIDPLQPMAPQVAALVNQTGLSSTELQTLPILVNPPSFNFIAVTLLVELHGLCGYFPAHLRLRPVQGSSPLRYEVAEVLDLQAVREAARRKRS